ncbi:3-keto-disaccharide hydrolase [Alteromonas gilva]|uniref:DUF1080 domain-containing protein n=1 Tax=Alteromonas gilva TaxID=2987522 RepID=A0ABT5KY05_9ALTE|nr:DUF1080 domain-containing protein [Alteromonas gilva]MDC8829513.1 DUF1080 domain-containing protein [Alteromonas gilva]
MKALSISVSAMLVLCWFNCNVAIAADNTLTDKEKSAGWELLFDGESLAQWRNYQKQTVSPLWRVKDGVLTLTGKGGGDLITRKQYDEFELKLDWKIAQGGNSGVFVLADEAGQYVYSHAPEIQLIDNERHADAKTDSRRAGSLYDLVAAPSAAFKPAETWNSLRIRLQDNVLSVWQNEVMTVHIVLHSSTWDKLVAASKFADWQGFAQQSSGYIGLQDHGDLVSFKNIKIKELP